MLMLIILQLEMYQPLRNEQQLQQHYGDTPVVTYAVPSAPRVCELYASRQTKVVGIILIIAGLFSIGLSIVTIVFGERMHMAFIGDGIWFGILVSLSCFMALFKCKLHRPVLRAR